MRHLLCNRPGCGDRHVAGRRQAFAGTQFEAAEWIRVVKGQAKAPTPDQRVMHVNNEPIPLRPGQYECDFCGEPIRPGDGVTAVTAWQPSRRAEPEFWEAEYIDHPTPSAAELENERRAIIEQEPRP